MDAQAGKLVADAAKSSLLVLGIRPTDEEVSHILGEEVSRLRAQLKSLSGITEALTGGRQMVVLGEGVVTLEPRPA